MEIRKQNSSMREQTISVRVWTKTRQEIDHFIRNYFADDAEVISLKSYKNRDNSGYYHYLTIREKAKI